MKYEEIKKLYESYNDDEEKKKFLDHVKSRREYNTEEGIILTSEFIDPSQSLSDFKDWLNKESTKLNANSKAQKDIYKINWNYDIISLEGLFTDLQNKGYITNNSKVLLLKHFNLKKENFKLMKKETDKLIWIEGPVKLIWLLNYLHQKKIISVKDDKVHFAGADHFCKKDLSEFKNRYLLQNLTNTSFKVKKKAKNENIPDQPEIEELIKRNISI